MADQDQDTPNRSSNMEKAEGDRPSEWGEGTSEGAGESNRSIGEQGGGPNDPQVRGPRPSAGTPDSRR
jgi:hypothetical protein